MVQAPCATVLGTVGSRGKAEIGRRNGCDHVIFYRETDFVSEVQRLIPNGVSAVFDGVRLHTFLPSLKCLRTFGHAVNYGNASGSIPPLEIQTLAVKSLSVSRVGVAGHIHDAVSLRKVTAELFDFVARGILFVDVQKAYALRDAAAPPMPTSSQPDIRDRCCSSHKTAGGPRGS